MAPSTSQLLLIGTSVVATLGVGYFFLSRSASEDGDEVKPRRKSRKRNQKFLEKGKVLQVLTLITQNLLRELSKEKQYEQALRAQYKDLPEDQIRTHMSDRFCELITKVQNGVYTASGITAAEFEKACTTAYKSDKDFLLRLQELKKVLEMSSPSAEVPSLDDLADGLQNVDNAVAIMFELVDGLTKFMEEAARELNPELKNWTPALQQKFQEKVTASTPEVQTKALDKYNIDQNELNTAVRYYASAKCDAKSKGIFQKAQMEMAQMQKRAVQSLGLAVGM
jgi:hypothetical protein